jgi:Mrp family chromosome partitioning ATPase
VEWGDLDYLVVDLPPGTGDEPLSIAQLINPVAGSIIVSTPQEVALLDAMKAVSFSKKMNVPVIGVIENMSAFACPHCGEPIDMFGSGGGKMVAETLSQNVGQEVPLLGRIPFDPGLREGGDAGMPFVLSHPDAPASRGCGGDASAP